ncbi:MAG: sugar transferase, partial [Bacilli bacterium]|nr:sugar transferase [Bacilli bacterium]
YDVRPGISGFAILRMHRQHDPKLKAALDSYYVRHLSIWMDAKIFFLSFLILLGINRRDQGR